MFFWRRPLIDYSELQANAEVVTMAGTGHFPTMEKPSECAQAILEFEDRAGRESLAALGGRGGGLTGHPGGL